MKAFFGFFAQRHLLAFLITLIIILLGIGSMISIKRDTFPSVDFGELLITTSFPGASPEDVELKVTNKIEKELKEVSGIKWLFSWSMEDVSNIHIVLESDLDDESKTVQEIREAVSRVTDFPPEVSQSPLVTEITTDSLPMIEIGLAGDIPYKDLRNLTKRFEKKLENITGVSKVQRFGYRDREIRVEVSPKALQDHDLNLAQLVSAIKKRNIRGTGGSFESYTSEKNIVTLAQFRKPEEVGDLVVRGTVDGPLVFVRDIATINDDFEAQKMASRINGKSAISLVAFKTSTADIIRTVDEIYKLVEKERKLLGEKVEILVSNDASTYVRKRFDIVITNGIIGLSLVVIALAVFLNLRIAFWVAMGIPVSILGVIFLLPIFGSFLDSVTMTAMVLVIGIIVDDAIIIAENIYRHYEHGLSPIDAAVEGVSKVFKPVVTTILTTFVVFLPLFFMPGMLGKFVYVIPLVVTLALFISLIESSIALPAHLAAGLTKSNVATGNKKKEFFSILRKRYWGLLKKLLRYRYIMIMGFVAVLISSLTFAYRYMDFVLFPSSTAERFMILLETPVGSSLKATSDRTQNIEQLVAQLGKQELHSYVTRIGTFGDIGSAERENNAAVWVHLTPYSSRDRTADEIIADLKKKTSLLDGFDKITYIVDAGGPPVGRPIVLRVVGADDARRAQLAGKIMTYLKTIEGVKDIDRDDKLGKQQVEVKLNYKRLARLGISAADVVQQIRIAYDGEIVTSVRYGDEDVNFRVIFTKEVRQDPNQLKELNLPNRGGHQTPLGKLAHFETIPGPANVLHFKGERVTTITGDVDKNSTTPLKVIQAIQQEINMERDFPDLQLVVGGEAEESEKSLRELFVIMAIATIGIYFLLILLFDSLTQPFLVMVAIPFGIIGVIIGFAINQEALGFLAMTGIIGLAGVVVNDSLVLVNHVNELRAQHGSRQLIDVVAEATANRLRAIILTTISTVLGLLPLAYGIGGSDPYMSPMALALGWGLLFATPLSLLLIPCLYIIADDVKALFGQFRSS